MLAVETPSDLGGVGALIAENLAETGATVYALTRDGSKTVSSGVITKAVDYGSEDALAEALQSWPRDGVPDNPGAWLTAVAKRRAIDGWRRRERRDEHERSGIASSCSSSKLEASSSRGESAESRPALRFTDWRKSERSCVCVLALD